MLVTYVELDCPLRVGPHILTCNFKVLEGTVASLVALALGLLALVNGKHHVVRMMW